MIINEEKQYKEIEEKILNGETEQLKWYCLHEYRAKWGTGSIIPFYSKEEAIAYAEQEWNRLAESDKKSYLNDVCSEFCVAELKYNVEEESFDISAYSPVWDGIEIEEQKRKADDEEEIDRIFNTAI